MIGAHSFAVYRDMYPMCTRITMINFSLQLLFALTYLHNNLNFLSYQVKKHCHEIIFDSGNADLTKIHRLNQIEHRPQMHYH